MNASIVFLLFIGVITAQTTTWPIASNCGPETPSKSADCTRIPMTDFKACCHVSLVKASVTTNICVAMANMKDTTAEKDFYEGQGYSTTIECPKQSAIPNTCGIVGVVEPIEIKDCTKINIPECYCCLIKSTINNVPFNSCRRLDEFPNKKSSNETIKSELKDFDATITSIDCSTQWLPKSFAIIVLLMIIL